MRIRTLTAVVVAVLLVGSVAACSKSSETGTSAGTESSQDSSSGDAVGDIPSNLGEAEGFLDNFLGEGCARAATYYALVGLSGLAAIGGLSEQQVNDYKSTLNDLRQGLPSELTDDIATVSQAYEEFFTAVGTSGANLFNPSPALDQAQAKIDSPEVKAANDNITSWLEQNCRG